MPATASESDRRPIEDLQTTSGPTPLDNFTSSDFDPSASPPTGYSVADIAPTGPTSILDTDGLPVGSLPPEVQPTREVDSEPAGGAPSGVGINTDVTVPGTDQTPNVPTGEGVGTAESLNIEAIIRADNAYQQAIAAGFDPTAAQSIALHEGGINPLELKQKIGSDPSLALHAQDATRLTSPYPNPEIYGPDEAVDVGASEAVWQYLNRFCEVVGPYAQTAYGLKVIPTGSARWRRAVRYRGADNEPYKDADLLVLSQDGSQITLRELTAIGTDRVVLNAMAQTATNLDRELDDRGVAHSDKVHAYDLFLDQRRQLARDYRFGIDPLAPDQYVGKLNETRNNRYYLGASWIAGFHALLASSNQDAQSRGYISREDLLGLATFFDGLSDFVELPDISRFAQGSPQEKLDYCQELATKLRGDYRLPEPPDEFNPETVKQWFGLSNSASDREKAARFTEGTRALQWVPDDTGEGRKIALDPWNMAEIITFDEPDGHTHFAAAVGGLRALEPIFDAGDEPVTVTGCIDLSDKSVRQRARQHPDIKYEFDPSLFPEGTTPDAVLAGQAEIDSFIADPGEGKTLHPVYITNDPSRANDLVLAGHDIIYVPNPRQLPRALATLGRQFPNSIKPLLINAEPPTPQLAESYHRDDAVIATNTDRRPDQYLPMQQRQIDINAGVIDFAKDLIPDHGIVYDPFTGLGAGLRSAHDRQFEVVGSDIARNFVAHVHDQHSGRVIVANAAVMPFADASFDTVMAVFGLDNIRSHQPFFRESARVLKPEGTVLFTDGGLTWWASDIVMHDIITNTDDARLMEWADSLIRGPRFNRTIPEFLEDKKIGSYFDEIVATQIDASRQKLELILGSVLDRYQLSLGQKANANTARKIGMDWRDQINHLYFSRIGSAAKSAGLTMVRSGKLLTWRQKDEEWLVGAVHRLPSGTDWTQIETVVIDSPDYKDEIMKANRAANLIVAPVVIFQKPHSKSD